MRVLKYIYKEEYVEEVLNEKKLDLGLIEDRPNIKSTGSVITEE